MATKVFFDVTVNLLLLWYPAVIIACVILTIITAKNFVIVVIKNKTEYLEPAFIIMIWPMILSVISKGFPFPKWNGVDSEVLWRYGFIIDIIVIYATIFVTIVFSIIRKARR